jgi:predicted signal transduction protein with EAL and GGDEF domain
MAVSVSIGLATFPATASRQKSILLAADRACFVAKADRAGPDRDGRRRPGRAQEFSLQEPTPIDA